VSSNNHAGQENKESNRENYRANHCGENIVTLEKFADKQSKMKEHLLMKQQAQQQGKDQRLISENPMSSNGLRVVQLEKELDEQKLIIDSLKRQQQLTHSDNHDKILKLEDMLNDQKKIFSNFVTEMSERMREITIIMMLKVG